MNDWLNLEEFLRHKYVIRTGGSDNNIEYLEAALDDLIKELTAHIEAELDPGEPPF